MNPPSWLVQLFWLAVAVVIIVLLLRFLNVI